jgi:hypothetical protein
VRLKVFLFTMEVDLKTLIVLSVNLIDPARYDVANFNNVSEFLIRVLKDCLLQDGGVEPVLQAADHFRVEHFGYSCCHNEAFFKCARGFVDEQVEETLVAY